MLAFRRPKSELTIAARRRIWQSADGTYRVVHARPLVGGLADIWYAMIRTPVPAPWRWCWDVLSRHRRRRAAFAAVERHARRGHSTRRSA